jgi:hypothetical protein
MSDATPPRDGPAGDPQSQDPLKMSLEAIDVPPNDIVRAGEDSRPLECPSPERADGSRPSRR